jgi:methionine-rich copper-binding protein CopC
LIRVRRAALAAALLGAAAVPPAAAHSLLISATPAPNAVLTASPPYVVLRFNNRIEKRLSRVRLVDERGVTATAPTARVDDETAESLVAAVPPLTAGAWRVEWQVFSTDGHVVSGSYGFRLAP